MSDLIQGLDVIFKLIPQLKSFTGARRREYFDKLVVPLFDAFENVHEFYNSLILDTRREVVRLNSGELRGALSILKSSGEPLNVEELGRLRDIMDAFFEKRQKDEHLRDALRQEAQAMFSAITWPDERRFLASVAYYFLGSKGIQPDDRDIDTDVTAVIEEGGIRHWDTPSVRLYNEMRVEQDPERLLEKMDSARNRLNQSYMNARLRFRNVQHRIVLTT